MEITENKLQKILTEQRSEFQHVVGIFKEDLQSKISLIAEQYQDIQSAQKSQTEMIGSLTEQYQEIKANQKTHTKMIGSLMEDVQIVKSDVQFLKRELKRKVDYDEFDALAKRVLLLEEKMRK